MKEDQAFGIIPLRKENEVWQVLMIRHRKGGHWGFPKGHEEKGEAPWQAAVRELREETGLEVVRSLQPDPLVEQYSFFNGVEPVKKTVAYFVAEVDGELHMQPQEIAEARWHSLPAAMEALTFAESRRLLQQVVDFLS